MKSRVRLFKALILSASVCFEEGQGGIVTYQDHNTVEDTLGCVGDQSLGAEVTRWNALKKKVKCIQDQIQECEDQLFALSVDQRAC
jgi:hypothetical protein